MLHIARATLLVLVAALGGLSTLQAQSLVPRGTAARYGLERAWFAQVGSPQATGRLEHVNYDEGMLLCQSSRGVITALDAESGRTLWSVRVGSSYGTSSEPAANEKYVVVLSGSTIYVLDRKDGGVAWQKQVRGARAPDRRSPPRTLSCP